MESSGKCYPLTTNRPVAIRSESLKFVKSSKGKGESLCLTCKPDSLWNVVRVNSVTRVPVRIRRDNIEARISDSGSSATLSPWRSDESYLSKEQRETLLTHPTEVKQTREVVKPEERNPVGSRIRL